MFIRNIVIIKVEIFHEELLVLKRENCFCLLFMVCNFMFNVQLNFDGQSSNLPDTTGAPILFREVDRSVEVNKISSESIT